MIYVTDEQNLYTDQGVFIKHVSCPLATRLARTVSAAQAEREFHCMHCQTRVKNLAYLTDQQALDAAQADDRVCFFATPAANNVVHITRPQPMHGLVRSWQRHMEGSEIKNPVIQTARTASAMNWAAANGFKLLFRRAGTDDRVQHQLAVYQKTNTGELVFTDDARFPPGYGSDGENAFVPIFDYFLYPPQGPASPVAAYVIPPDLAPGTQVFVEDAIEDLVCQMPQETAERMSGWWAVWDGEDLNFLRHQEGGLLG
jgi:hypothetical protein